MVFRGVTAAAAIVVLLGVVTACVPEPPTPTPTPLFDSDEEAFAAAEATYREYVDRSNEIDLADPGTFEPVFELTIGDQHASDRKDLSQYHANGYVFSGRSLILRIAPDLALSTRAKPVLTACLDVSGVDLRSATGESVVRSDRGDTQQIEIEFDADEAASNRMYITSIGGSTRGSVCD